MLESKRVHSLEIKDSGGVYRANYFVEDGQIHIASGGAAEVMAFAGLPPEIAAKLILARWIYEGRVVPKPLAGSTGRPANDDIRRRKTAQE